MHPNVRDLTGNTYGRLVVLAHAGSKKFKKGTISLWHCQCECGNTIIVYGSNLKNRSTTTCGCSRKGLGRIDITGHTYGRLTVLRHLEDDKWLCRCTCGTERSYASSAMRTGNTKSCGCRSREHLSIRSSEYGHLDSINSRGNKFKWHVIKNGQRINLRSSYEVIFAEYLIREGIDFLYEPRLFVLEGTMRYRPDFYIPKIDTWYEMKGLISERAAEKLRLFPIVTGNKLIVIGPKEIDSYLPPGLTNYKFMRNWCEKHQVLWRNKILPLASVESSTTYNQNSLAA